MSFRKNLLVLLSVGLAVLALAGCASPTPAPTPVPPTVAPTKAPTAAPTSVPPTVAPTKAPTAAPTTQAAAPTTAPTASSSATTTSEASAPPVPNCAASDCTKPGPAITQNLKGDVAAGQKVFVDNCEKCHGKQGVGGVDNPGSTDGTVPPLNPIDPAFSTKDRTKFAAQIDAFVEHGSTPDGPNPKNVMDAWGDNGKLTPQQIADVIAYVMSLNK